VFYVHAFSWLNFPVSGSLEDDAYKATNILRTFMAASRLEPERQLPASVLRGARGLALMSVLRVGAGWSATVGTGEGFDPRRRHAFVCVMAGREVQVQPVGHGLCGRERDSSERAALFLRPPPKHDGVGSLAGRKHHSPPPPLTHTINSPILPGLVVSRQLDGSWSPPCAAACYGVGWGAQIGGEVRRGAAQGRGARFVPTHAVAPGTHRAAEARAPPCRARLNTPTADACCLGPAQSRSPFAWRAPHAFPSVCPSLTGPLSPNPDRKNTLRAQLADVVLVLRTDEALQAFCSSAHLAVSGSAAASLGPVGRRAQAGLQVGAAGGGAAVGYSCSRGAFVGVAVEGSVFVVRDAANLAFYGGSCHPGACPSLLPACLPACLPDFRGLPSPCEGARGGGLHLGCAAGGAQRPGPSGRAGPPLQLINA
jgi:lipid-binding SYLF domain-containing protein